MHYLFFIQVLLVAVIYGCRESKMPVQEFIPGTYIRYSQHEFGSEYDMLVITPLNVYANEFSILRKWKYERVLDGVVIGPEYKKSVTTAVYDNEVKLLREIESGEVYSFDISDNTLLNGTIKYKKL